MDALNYMSGFDQRMTRVITAKPHIPYAFQASPQVIYAAEETPPRVYAVVELFGLVFTQGTVVYHLSRSRF